MLSILVVATMLVWGSPCFAQGKKTSDHEKAQAAEAFKTGQDLFTKGSFLKAATAFEKAYELAPHPSVLANIGYCYDEAGDYPRAVEIFREYMKQPNPGNAERNADIAKYLRKTQFKVGDLHVNCYPARCKVTVDNVSRDLAPTTLVVSAGVHHVGVVPVDGGQIRRYKVTVPEGGEHVLDVDFTQAFPETSQTVPADTAQTVPADTVQTVPSDTVLQSDRKPPRLRAPFWVSMAFTIGGAVSTAVFGGLALKNWYDFRAGGSVDIDQKMLGKNLVTGTNISISVTATAAVASIIFAMIDLMRYRAKRDDSKTAKQSKKFSLNLAAGAFLEMSIKFN